MRPLGRILSAALMIVIVPLFMLSACNLAFERTIRNPDIYKNAFENLNVYNDLLSVALPAIFQVAHTGDVQPEGIPVEFSDIATALDDEDWRVITAELIPPAWLKTQFEQIVDATLSVLNNDFSALDRPVDLAELKTRLTGDSAGKAADYIINSAPPCDEPQLEQLTAMSTDPAVRLPVCNPPDETLRASSINHIIAWLNAVGSTLPEATVTIGEFYEVNRQGARAGYLLGQLNSQILIFLYLCPVALCALIVFFAVRSLKGFGRWMGCVGMLTGIGILLLLVLLQVALLSLIGSFIDTSSEIERFFASIFTALVRSIIAGAGSGILIQAGVFISVGFVLLALSFLVRAPDESLIAAGSVIISDDGQVISTASRPGGTVRPLPPDDTKQ